MLNILRLSSILMLALFCCASSLAGQSTKAEITARLNGKPLYLRGFWGDDDLKFNAEGKLVGTSNPVSFTVSGFEFKNAHLEQDKLILEGARTVTEFVEHVPKRVWLNSDIHLEIALPATGDFGPALDAIFADGLSALAPSLPSYWQAFARCHLIEPANAADCSLYPTKAQVREQYKNVTFPVLTKRAPINPHSNNYAVRLRYNGMSVIELVVGPDGRPSAVTILAPIGVGQDEQALASVEQYRFVPATKDGKPVALTINIDVPMDVF